MLKNEIKYLIAPRDYPRIKQAMKPYLRRDKYAGPEEKPEYTVHSVYLDTWDLKFYRQKIDGIRKRLKVRIRGYDEINNDSIIFLELKRKKNDVIFKNRYPCLFKNANNILNREDVLEKVDFEQNPLDKERFIFNYLSLSLKPIILISYEREAFHYKFNDKLRITFDKNIRSTKANSIDSLRRDEYCVPTFKNKSVLEIKSAGPFPDWVLTIIKRFGLQRQSVSKYTLSMDKQYEVNSLYKMVNNGNGLRHLI